MKNAVEFYVEDRSKLLQKISTTDGIGAVACLKSALQETKRILAVYYKSFHQYIDTDDYPVLTLPEVTHIHVVADMVVDSDNESTI